MRHGDDRSGDTCRCAGSENLIEKWNEYSQPLEGEALGAKIAGLNDLLKEIGTNELSEDMSLVGLGRGLFHVLLQPLPLLRVRNVHEFDAKSAGVETTSFRSGLTLGNCHRKRLGRKVLAQRIKGGLQIAPPAENIENNLAVVLL